MTKNNKELYVLFASRLVQEKGIVSVIDTINFLQKNNPSLFEAIQWNFCSEGDYVNQIEAFAKKYPNIQYYGVISREKLAELYRKSDILLMPSVFLETFGLTALESNACGTGVIGPRKGGLTDFISQAHAIDESNPTASIINILERKVSGEREKSVDIELYRPRNWQRIMKTLFENQKKILLVHDYKDRIGGAEVYVESLEKPFREMGKTVAYAHYENKTSRIKRKFLFASAILGYFRQRRIQKKLAAFRPDTIWMHSVLRYHGIWSIRQIQKYIQKYPNTKVYLSHHDIGLLAPFPQDITQEEQIPKNDSLKEFTKGLKGRKKAIATLKWLYVLWLKKNLPKSTEHIIFAPFLAKHIHNHFGDQRIIILPHTFDEQIFHP